MKPKFISTRFDFDRGSVHFKPVNGTTFNVEVYLSAPIGRLIAYRVQGRQIMNKTYAVELLEMAEADHKGK